MELGLSGKVVLISGESKGIGFACAQGFFLEGLNVAICSRYQQNIDRKQALSEFFASDLDNINGLNGCS